MGWWKCAKYSKIRLWLWLHNSENTLNSTELCTLNGWLQSIWLYFNKAVKNNNTAVGRIFSQVLWAKWEGLLTCSATFFFLMKEKIKNVTWVVCVESKCVWHRCLKEWKTIRTMGQREVYKLKTKDTDKTVKTKAFFFVFLETNASTYCFLLLAEQFGTGQKVFILCIRNNWFWKFSEIKFEKRRHCVHIRVAVETEAGRQSLEWTVHRFVYCFTKYTPKHHTSIGVGMNQWVQLSGSTYLRKTDSIP